MKVIFGFLALLVLSGCVGDNCFRPNGLGSATIECAKYRATHSPPATPSHEWYEYVIFPLLFVADAGSKSVDTQNAVTGSQHYQAGGSAARDYTK